MTNMSYCIFENTLQDLRQAHDKMEDDRELSQAEQEAKEALIDLCKEIAQYHGGN